jgi:hypothetical protein
LRYRIRRSAVIALADTEGEEDASPATSDDDAAAVGAAEAAAAAMRTELEWEDPRRAALGLPGPPARRCAHHLP